jgi:hypothetical protein
MILPNSSSHLILLSVEGWYVHIDIQSRAKKTGNGGKVTAKKVSVTRWPFSHVMADKAPSLQHRPRNPSSIWQWPPAIDGLNGSMDTGFL